MDRDTLKAALIVMAAVIIGFIFIGWAKTSNSLMH